MHQYGLKHEASPSTTKLMETVVAELIRRGANREGHGRGTILTHLIGTHDILALWNQPERVCFAGLLHNAYSTEAFTPALFDQSERDQVRAMIGAAGERLVHIFGRIKRETLFNHLEAGGGKIAAPFHLVDRVDGSELELDRRDVGELLVLYLANLADQAAMADGGPALWLASASRIANWVAQNAEVVPPVLDNCRAEIADEADEAALAAYDTALRSIAGDLHFAKARLEEATEHLPFVAEPFLWLACLAFADGDMAGAKAAFAQTRLLFDQWGTGWDKRLTISQQHALSAALAALLENSPSDEAQCAVKSALKAVTNSPLDFYQALAEAGLIDSPTGENARDAQVFSPKFTAFPARFRDYLKRHMDGNGAPMGIGIYPGLTAKLWYDPDKFPIAAALEEAVDVIARELARLDTQAFSDEPEDIARVGRWRVLYLQKKDVDTSDIREKCPITSEILDSHQDATAGAGVAYFSCLDPGTRVAPHRGPTNTRLRLHLGLEVPEKCGLRVGGVKKKWTPGRCLVFDDSFIHDVWNESDRRRIVLIVDIWHPDLTPEEVALLQWMAN